MIKIDKLSQKFKTVLNSKTNSERISDQLKQMSYKFTQLISNGGEPLKDPLLKKNIIKPETTEEIDSLIQDSMNLVTLLQREFSELKEQMPETGITNKLAKNVLIELEEIETILQSPEILEFDLNTETMTLDAAFNAANIINVALKYAAGEIKLKPDVYSWSKELKENIEKISDLAMEQSTFMERYFAVNQKRMVERDERDIDEIDPAEIHVDYDDPEYFSDEAILNELEVKEQLEKKYPASEAEGEYGELYNDIAKEKERSEWGSGKRHK